MIWQALRAARGPLARDRGLANQHSASSGPGLQSVSYYCNRPRDGSGSDLHVSAYVTALMKDDSYSWSSKQRPSGCEMHHSACLVHCLNCLELHNFTPCRQMPTASQCKVVAAVVHFQSCVSPTAEARNLLKCSCHSFSAENYYYMLCLNHGDKLVFYVWHPNESANKLNVTPQCYWRTTWA